MSAPRLVSPGRKLQAVQHGLNRSGRVVASCDWLSWSVPATHPNEIADALARFGVPGFVEAGHGFGKFRQVAFAPGGVKLFWDRIGATGGATVHVEMPGQHCQAMGLGRMRKLLRYVVRRGGRVSRLDVTFDDLDRMTSISGLLESWRRSEHVTHAKSIEFRGMMDSQAVQTGAVVYVGKGSSDSMLRVYDKALEQMKRNRELLEATRYGVRWELQLRDDRSDLAAACLSALDLEEWPQFMTGLLRGFLDFRDRSADSNVSRCPVVAWWHDFTGGADQARLAIPKRYRTLARLHSWLVNTASASLATLVLAWGDQWEDHLVQFVTCGIERMRARHHVLLEPN